MSDPAENLLSLASDPQADALAEAVALIKKGIEAQPDDPGAVFTEEMKAAWVAVYMSSQAEFERLRKDAKKSGARVTEIDKLIGARSKFSSGGKRRDYLSNNPSQPSQTRPVASQTLHAAFTNPETPSQNAVPEAGKVQPNALLEYDDNDVPKRMIDSRAAVILADSLRDDLAWNHRAGSWLLWRSTHWESQTQPAEAEQILADAVDIGTRELGFRMAYLNGVTQIMCRRNLLPRPDQPAGCVPFSNGLLSIDTGELRPATPAHSLDWCLPHAYSNTAECPEIKAWMLDAVGGDADSVELLRAWLAALIRGIPLQYFLMLIGPGGSGKSTFVDLATALIGEMNMCISTLRDIEENRFEAAKFFGKRLLSINEAGKHGGALNMLKAITGRDPIPLERKHVQQSGSFVFEGLVLLASNEDLQAADSTSGLERRRVTVRFDKRVSAAERADWIARGGAGNILHREIPGLIRWCLELSPKDIHDIFEHPPQRVATANLLGMQAGNSVADWLIENCIPEPGRWAQIGVKKEFRINGATAYERSDEWLYPNYLTWCLESGRNRPVSLKKFRSTTVDIAKRLGLDVKDGRQPGTGKTCITNIRLRAENEPPFDWTSLQSVKVSERSANACDGKSEATAPGVKDVRGVNELYPNNFAKKRKHYGW